MSDLITDRNTWVDTPLPAGVVALEAMEGHEALGRPFAYELTLVSTDWNIDLSTLLGQPVTVHSRMSNGAIRHFNGIVTKALQLDAQGAFARYGLTLQPWLWLLDYGWDCRIFQHAAVPEIVKEVFRKAGFVDFEDTLDPAAYDELEYCVQYRESDFNFVSRLMEHEGIYYFFKHDEGKHTLVLADSYGAHAPRPGYQSVEYKPPQVAGRVAFEYLSSWTLGQKISSGGYATTDFDFKSPRTALLSSLGVPKNHAHAGFEVFDYPGHFLAKPRGDARARMRLEERQAEYQMAQSSGDVRGLGAGDLFKLASYPREDQNQEYLVVGADYTIQAGNYESSGPGGAPDAFHVNLTLLPSQVPYRPPFRARKSRVEGPQTAIVVGKQGEEIWTDKYGRVLVQFHWDRDGMSDERSSCWIRVTQVWAGAKWGAMHIPRIGQEVIVDFLEGDPDRPIITGRVYNGDNMPPYALPENKTQSGLKSRSTLGGGPGNFNEIRFEDKKGAEQLYIQAEKNQDNLVKADDSLTVGGSRTKSIGVDETVSVGSNRTETVGADEQETIGVNQTVAVGANQSITVGANQTLKVAASRSISVGASQTETISIASAETIGAAKALTVGGAYQVTVGAAMNETVGGLKAEEIGGAKSVNVGAASSENVGGNKSVSAGSNLSESAGANVSVSAGKKVELSAGTDVAIAAAANGIFTAGDKLALKCGSATIVLKKNGDITINGKKIEIKGSGDIIIKGSNVIEN